MIFEIISGGEKTDWVGKEWASLFFPQGKNGPAHSFPGEKTDWGEIPACYTGMPKAYRDTYLRTPKSRYTGIPVILRTPNYQFLLSYHIYKHLHLQ